MSNKKSESSSRRDFIKTAGLGVGVAAVASGVLSAGGAVAEGYRETEHVKQYYESAKY
jgi:hypothetical protein